MIGAIRVDQSYRSYRSTRIPSQQLTANSQQLIAKSQQAIGMREPYVSMVCVVRGELYVGGGDAFVELDGGMLDVELVVEV